MWLSPKLSDLPPDRPDCIQFDFGSDTNAAKSSVDCDKHMHGKTALLAIADRPLPAVQVCRKVAVGRSLEGKLAALLLWLCLSTGKL